MDFLQHPSRPPAGPRRPSRCPRPVGPFRPWPVRRSSDRHPAAGHRRIALALLALVLASILLTACEDERREMQVTASAYNTVAWQTHPDHPEVGAWGDSIQPGMQVIAVSRDLLDEGLIRGVEVEIDEMDGTWTVLDLMHARWERSIDIYMGEDIEAAQEWGRQEVTIRWQPAEEERAEGEAGSMP